MKISEREQSLLELLEEIPPRFQEAEALILREGYNPDEVTRTAICYADGCFGEVRRQALRGKKVSTVRIVEGLHSSYIYLVTEFLLKFGLLPNGIYEFDDLPVNLMGALTCVDNEYLAADALALLLENGGDPNLEVDGQTLFEELDFSVFFGRDQDGFRPGFAGKVHCWMVMMAYGGRHRQDQGRPALYFHHPSGSWFRLEQLRDHRRFGFALTHMDDCAGIVIYDRDTFWEVARF